MKLRWGILLLICLLLAGCAGEGQELVELENENARLTKENENLRLSNAALTNRVNGLEQMNLALKMQMAEEDGSTVDGERSEGKEDTYDGLSIEVVSKVNDPKKSEQGQLRHKVRLLIALENNFGKTITAIEGDVIVADLFGREILRIPAPLLNKRVMSYGVANYSDIVYEINSMDAKDSEFYQTPFEALTFSYSIRNVITE